MKKLYTLLAAAAVVVSASAQKVELKLNGNFELQNYVAKKEVVNTEATSAKMVAKELNLENRQILAATKADDNQSIEGDWTFYFGDFYLQSSGSTILEAQYEAVLVREEEDGFYYDVNGGLVYFDSNEYLPIIAEYDNTTGVLSFERIFLAMNGSYYVYLTPYVIDGGLFVDSFTGKYDGKDTISFGMDHLLGWDACSDAAGNMVLGYYGLYDLDNGAERFVSSWTNVGYATLMDGWVLPLFGVDQYDPYNQWEVALERNDQNENLYRLVDPYHCGPIQEAGLNQSTTVGYIVFDVTDPEHVTFQKANAGFAYAQAGLNALYCYNSLSALAYHNNVSFSTVISVYGDEMPYTTFKDGVVSLGHVIDEDGELWYDAMFGISSTTFAYAWTDEDGNAADMTASITFPENWDGVKAIETEATTGATRYYNLQGVEVANPAAGTIVIKVDGKNASKILVK